LMSLTPKQPSLVVKPLVKMALGKLRLMGAFHIALGLFLLLALVTNSPLVGKLSYILFIFPVLQVILLLIMESYYIRNKNAIKKASTESAKDITG
jgi:uncharacterized protein YjeT (DUF2065 family)